MILLVAERTDRETLRPVVEAVRRLGHTIGEADAVPAEGVSDDATRLALVWSRRAERSGLVSDGLGSVIRAWSEGRLVLARLDDAPLPLGLRDLEGIEVDPASPLRSTLVQNLLTGTIDPAPPVVAYPEPEGRIDARIAPSDIPPVAPEGASPSGPARSARGIRFSALVLVSVLALVAACAVVAWTMLSRGPPPRAPAPGQPPSTSSPASAMPQQIGLLALGGALGGVVTLFLLRRRRREERPGPSNAPPANGAESAATSAAALPGQPQIFVSYSRRNEREVDRVVHELERLGFGIWIDRQASGGSRYAAKIVGGIRASGIVALMSSKDALASDHVTREIYVAGDWRKPFIVFQLDDADIPDELLYFLSGFPRIPATAIDPQGLRDDISRLVAA